MIGALNRLGVEVRRGLSQFAVGSKEPSLGFDFIDNTYLADGTKNLSQALTHSRNGNATMTDGYGPELIVNGGFDSDSDWTLGTGWSIADGVASCDGTQVLSSDLTQSLGVTLGTLYEVVFTVSNYSAGNVVAAFTVGGTAGTGKLADGRYVEFLSGGSSGDLVFRTSPAFVGSIDNVSVREMPAIKWAPHNLTPNSEDFSGNTLLGTGTTYTSNQATTPSGSPAGRLSNPTTAGSIRSVGPNAVSGQRRSLALTFKVVSGDGDLTFGSASRETFTIDISTLAITEYNPAGWVNDGTELTNLGDGWYRVESSEIPASSPETRIQVENSTGFEILISEASSYRSDLGGMVDNPERGDSYVPTTASASYLPRVGHHVYNGDAWANEGLLHESEARTNLFTYSEDFTDASWAKANTATLAVDAVGPDGQTSAVTLVDNGATGTGTVRKSYSVTVSTSTAYTYSEYFKADQLGWVLMWAGVFTTPADGGAYFDLSNGVIGTISSGFTATMESVGNGWYRCSITFTTDPTDTSGQLQTYVSDGDGSFTVDRDGTSSILAYGAQFEAGSTPSSYIPTAGATVTRAAETLTVPAANLPWPYPEVIGDELVTNGTFDTDISGWTEEGGATTAITSGELELTGDGAYDDSLRQVITLTAGSVYVCTGTVRAGTSAARIAIRNTSGGALLGGVTVTETSNQEVSFTFTASAEVRVDLLQWATAGGTAYFDNISVREINPLSVSIQMDGRMTYADENTTQTVKLYRWREDVSNFFQPAVFTDTIRTGLVAFEQFSGGVYDSVSTSGDYYSPGVLVPYNIASRHGSTFVNGAVDGVALTVNTTPVELPDLSATDLDLGFDYMGTIGTFRVWDQDLGDDGIVTASAPSLEPSLSLTFDGSGLSFTVLDWSE